MSASHPIRIGFLPLLDCAPLVVAGEKGFFQAQGLAVELRKGQSWPQIRDWLLAGQLEAAHMLLTMPIQCTLGLGSPRETLVTAFTLNRRGNGIILGNALWNAGARDAMGLSAWMAAHPGERLRLGVVFPRGTQEYFLRWWLGQAGLAVGDRIALSVIPPQEMVGRLRKGEVEGFCVAEPWSRRAAASKLGRLVAESGVLLPGLGDKVLAVKEAWHRGNPGPHAALVRALAMACAWLEDPANLPEAVELLASRRYVNTPKSVVAEALAEERAARDAAGPPPAGAHPHQPFSDHIHWYIAQMLRWRHLDPLAAADAGLPRVCLDAFHRDALAGRV